MVTGPKAADTKADQTAFPAARDDKGAYENTAHRTWNGQVIRIPSTFARYGMGRDDIRVRLKIAGMAQPLRAQLPRQLIQKLQSVRGQLACRLPDRHPRSGEHQVRRQLSKWNGHKGPLEDVWIGQRQLGGCQHALVVQDQIEVDRSRGVFVLSATATQRGFDRP